MIWMLTFSRYIFRYANTCSFIFRTELKDAPVGGGGDDADDDSGSDFDLPEPVFAV
jgi:hypothetical protein